MGPSPCIAEYIRSPLSLRKSPRKELEAQGQAVSRTMLKGEKPVLVPYKKISINCTSDSSLNYLNNRICKVNEKQNQDCDRKCLT